MTSLKKQYSCTNCGKITAKWVGQCPECQSWGTFAEEIVARDKANTTKHSKVMDYTVLDAYYSVTPRVPIAIAELSRVLGGGLVTGSAVLLGGSQGLVNLLSYYS